MNLPFRHGKQATYAFRGQIKKMHMLQTDSIGDQRRTMSSLTYRKLYIKNHMRTEIFLEVNHYSSYDDGLIN